VGAAGLLALTLACFGIFGVVVYGVAMRTREIGIRRALGANAPSIVGLVLGQLLVPVSTGMLLGTAAGLAVGTVLARQPFYLPASDIFTPVLVLLFFALTATAAAIVPATRALGVEPLRALRHD
jgi:ABC-type antimicrobial peptide transport system permease subunit